MLTGRELLQGYCCPVLAFQNIRLEKHQRDSGKPRLGKEIIVARDRAAAGGSQIVDNNHKFGDEIVARTNQES